METTQKAKSNIQISEKLVLEKSLQYFQGDELSATTWMKKYAVKNEKGEYQESSPEHKHRRVAKEFARIEKNLKSDTKEGLSSYGKKENSYLKKNI